MKKLALLLISLVLIFGIIGCNNDVNKPKQEELPSVELPEEFNPDKEGSSYNEEISVDDQKLLSDLVSILVEKTDKDFKPKKDVMEIAYSLIGAAMDKGISLTLPNSNGKTLSVDVKGVMDASSVAFDISSKVDYSFADISMKGDLVAKLTIDLSMINGHHENQSGTNSEGTESKSSYNFYFDEGKTTLEVTVGKVVYPINDFIKKYCDNTIKVAVDEAIKKSYEQIMNDALSMIANFFKEGYVVKTEDLQISLKGDFKYAIAIPSTSKEVSIFNYYSKFGNYFKYISLENIVFEVKTIQDITLDNANINGHIIIAAPYAKLEPATEKIWYKDPLDKIVSAEINGIKASISVDPSCALKIKIGEKTHEIYAKGHFDGISGASGGIVEGQGFKTNAYLRIDENNYNLTQMINDYINKQQNKSELPEENN